MIDEAHCITEWGHNFRPAYLRLGIVADTVLPEASLLALTATATRATERAVRRHLRIPDHGVLRDATVPLTLRLHVETVAGDALSPGVRRRLLELLTPPWGALGHKHSVIVYTGTKHGADVLAQTLYVQGISALAYHAGKKPEERLRVERLFKEGKLRAVVATVAFGMGVDVRSVGGVVHIGVPRSIEEYVQQVGRAGRSGAAEGCHLLLSETEYITHRSLAASDAADEAPIRALLDHIFACSSSSSPHTSTAMSTDQRRQIDDKEGEEEVDEEEGVVTRGGIRILPIDRLAVRLDLKTEVMETVCAFLEDIRPFEIGLMGDHMGRSHGNEDGVGSDDDRLLRQGTPTGYNLMSRDVYHPERSPGLVEVLPGSLERVTVLFYAAPRTLALSHPVVAAVLDCATSSTGGKFHCRIADLCAKLDAPPTEVLQQLSILAGIRPRRKTPGPAAAPNHFGTTGMNPMNVNMNLNMNIKIHMDKGKDDGDQPESQGLQDQTPDGDDADDERIRFELSGGPTLAIRWTPALFPTRSRSPARLARLAQIVAAKLKAVEFGQVARLDATYRLMKYAAMSVAEQDALDAAVERERERERDEVVAASVEDQTDVTAGRKDGTAGGTERGEGVAEEGRGAGAGVGAGAGAGARVGDSDGDGDGDGDALVWEEAENEVGMGVGVTVPVVLRGGNITTNTNTNTNTNTIAIKDDDDHEVDRSTVRSVVRPIEMGVAERVIRKGIAWYFDHVEGHQGTTATPTPTPTPTATATATVIATSTFTPSNDPPRGSPGSTFPFTSTLVPPEVAATPLPIRAVGVGVGFGGPRTTTTTEAATHKASDRNGGGDEGGNRDQDQHRDQHRDQYRDQHRDRDVVDRVRADLFTLAAWMQVEGEDRVPVDHVKWCRGSRLGHGGGGGGGVGGKERKRARGRGRGRGRVTDGVGPSTHPHPHPHGWRTPRVMARILHGLQSPAFEAKRWREAPGWNTCRHVDFARVLTVAAEVLSVAEGETKGAGGEGRSDVDGGGDVDTWERRKRARSRCGREVREVVEESEEVEMSDVEGGHEGWRVGEEVAESESESEA